MKSGRGASSLTGRLIAATLVVEVALCLFVTMAALYYQHNESLRAFDVMLRGRADSVLGSVQDAEDAGNDVMLDKTTLDVPGGDLYVVREEEGHLLGGEGVGGDELRDRLRDDQLVHNFKLRGIRYRGMVLHGSRLIDTEHAPGVLRKVVISYASPVKPVWAAVKREARFFVLADVIALLLSCAAVAWLIRRNLRPLDELAARAATITSRSWSFQAPASAYGLREVAPLASALDVALQGLARAFQQQRTFVSDAAHELKTAVTVLKSSLQLLTFRERSRDEYQQGIELCLSDTGRMEELVQRMLTLARLEHSDGARSRTSACSLAEALRLVMAQVESAAAIRRVRMVEEIADEGSVGLSAEDASTLLMNLVINAIQHSHTGSRIALRLFREEGKVVFSLSDQGDGIAAEHLPFVFERFYRADASRSRETGGTGLGLSICKAIVDGAAGAISIESVVDVGTTVTVRLPAVSVGVRDRGVLAGLRS